MACAMIMNRSTNAHAVRYHSECMTLEELRYLQLSNEDSCSVACATLHRATHPAVSDDIPPASSEALAPPLLNGMASKISQGNAASTCSRNAFTVLEGSKELQTLFMMYPRLRSQLRDIYTATLPSTEGSSSMSGHYYEHQQLQRGRGRGRGRGGRVRDRGPWNTDRGTQDGIDALCDAKEQYGKGGEGIREYAELVLKLVAAEGVDVAQLVQQEVAEENAKIIAQLLNGDSY